MVTPRTHAGGTAILTLALCGCFGTAPPPYVPHGPSGGYSEYRVAHDAHEVRYAWSGLVGLDRPDPDAIADFALLRSAEVAQGDGYRYFCLASIHRFTGHTSYTVRLLRERPGEPELAEERAGGPKLYSCYSAIETRRVLREKYGVHGYSEAQGGLP
jgi:hypothetical protein